MKINMNNIGNYSPRYINEVKAKADLQKPVEAPGAEKISTEEKNFFINMYPENKKDIVDYHFYQKSGKMNGVSVGSLFDKRG